MYQSTHTGAQVDEAVDKVLASPISMMSNRNLLDNWYFVGGGSQQGGGQFPINQRGNLTYTNVGYGIDRWTDFGAGTVTVNSGGVTLSASGQLFQYLEPSRFVDGAAYTLSCILNGKLYFTTFDYDASSSAGTSRYVSCDGKANLVFYYNLYSLGNHAVGLNAVTENVTINAIKLEMGSVSTLANDAPPCIAEELAKCQRYYWEMKASAAYALLAFGMGTASNVASFKIQHPVTMRDSASVTASGTFGCDSASFASATFRNNSGAKTTNYSFIEFDTTISQGTATTLQDFGSNNATLKFSADL